MHTHTHVLYTVQKLLFARSAGAKIDRSPSRRTGHAGEIRDEEIAFDSAGRSSVPTRNPLRGCTCPSLLIHVPRVSLPFRWVDGRFQSVYTQVYTFPAQSSENYFASSFTSRSRVCRRETAGASFHPPACHPTPVIRDRRRISSPPRPPPSPFPWRTRRHGGNLKRTRAVSVRTDGETIENTKRVIVTSPHRGDVVENSPRRFTLNLNRP